MLAGGASASALDLFTLWRQPELPLRLVPGAWADYRSSTLEGGQQSVAAMRIQCVGRAADGAWEIEMLPLLRRPEGAVPEAGEGWVLLLSERVARREGDLADLVRKVVHWQAGQATELSAAQWREDPLVSSSLRAAFRPQTTRAAGESVRVVGGRELLCRQYELAAAETTRVTLPRGTLVQTTLREITAAVHPEVPFLGLAFATERTTTASHVEPPRPGRRDPPPAVRVELMELLAFGGDARRTLGVH
ncbi:MAG: hypothetical protein ACYDIE_06880 [Candidatus Krumholzibacteriia bacterium]